MAKGRTRLKEIKRIAKWRKEEGRKAAEKAFLEKIEILRFAKVR